MKVRVLVLVVILTAVVTSEFRSVSAQAPQDPRRNFRLQVTAAGDTSLHVRGAVWMDGSNTNVTIVDGQTPLDMETFGTVVNGILKVDGRDRIRVQVTDEASGTSMLSAEGHAIIVGQGLAQNTGWRFIRTEQ